MLLGALFVIILTGAIVKSTDDYSERDRSDSSGTVAPLSNCSEQFLLTEQNDFTAYIEFPFFPAHHVNDTECGWYVSAPSAIEITAEYFHTENCTSDVLHITDISTNITLGIFCGEYGPVKLRSYSGEVSFLLEPYAYRKLLGFRFRLKITLSKCSAYQTTCPNHPDICFEPEMMCDGKNDCPGGEDEYCPIDCGKSATQGYLRTNSDDKVIAGLTARPHSWPWAVSMQIRTFSNRGVPACGGSIIDRNWILTAGHCCAEIVNPLYQIFVRVGEHDLKRDVEPNARTHMIKKVFMHPNYEYGSANPSNDLCLLKTEHAIFFNDDVFPICLPSSRIDPPVGTVCYVTGWGNMERNPLTSRESDIIPGYARFLQQVDLSIVSQEKCQEQYSTMNISIKPDQMCAASPGRFLCTGDSGSPFVCRIPEDPFRWEQRGVAAFALCGDPRFSDGFARTSHSLDWIADVLLNN